MATQTMHYDHPAYTVPRVEMFVTTAGANGVSANRFVAFTDVILKSAQVTVVTAGTSATTGHKVDFKKIVSSGTTTTSFATIALNTLTAGVTTNVSLANTELAAGETMTFTNGTDATGVAAIAVEYLVKPRASVTL